MKSISIEANAFLASHDIYKPCRKAYHLLARYFPKDLIALIESGDLEPCTLTFAVESCGSIQDSVSVRKTLLPLLKSSSLIVVEGTILGLVHHMDKEVIDAFRSIAENDTSISSFAKDILKQENLDIVL